MRKAERGRDAAESQEGAGIRKAVRVRKATESRRKAAVKGAAVNALGIVLAFGAAFGEVFLVQEGLARETAGALRQSGEMRVPVPSAGVQASGMPGIDWEETGRKLTQEELLAAVAGLEGKGESYPHEPLPGQLSMAQAIECGREWLEDFFMPYLGMSGDDMKEYRINCFLWARRAPDGGEQTQDSLLSYWTVSFGGADLEAGLVLNAASGQVLEASVTVKAPVEYQAQEELMKLFQAYAESFGTTEDYLFVDAEGGDLYQRIGDEGLYAALKTGSIVIDTAKPGGGETSSYGGEASSVQYTELLSLQLYLGHGDMTTVFLPAQETELFTWPGE